VAGTPAFVELARRFRLQDQTAALVTLASTPGTNDALAANAAATAVELGGTDAVTATITGADEPAARLLEVLGIRGDKPAVTLLEATIRDAAAPPQRRSAAVRGLARVRVGGVRDGRPAGVRGRNDGDRARVRGDDARDDGHVPGRVLLPVQRVLYGRAVRVLVRVRGGPDLLPGSAHREGVRRLNGEREELWKMRE
jgi:hypothetical protein